MQSTLAFRPHRHRAGQGRQENTLQSNLAFQPHGTYPGHVQQDNTILPNLGLNQHTHNLEEDGQDAATVTRAENDNHVEKYGQGLASRKRKEIEPFEQNHREEANSHRQRIRDMNEKAERMHQRAAKQAELRKQDNICLRIRRKKSTVQLPTSGAQKLSKDDALKEALRLEHERIKTDLTNTGLYQQRLAKAYSKHSRWVDGDPYPVFQQDRSFEYAQKIYEAPANNDECDDADILEMEGYSG
jgi:hypothetical protein